MGIEINEDGEIVGLGRRVEITIDVQELHDEWSADGGWEVVAPDGHVGVDGDRAARTGMIDSGPLWAASRWLSERAAECEARRGEPG